MIAAMLFMFIGGIALTMAISDPRQVTLRWLRLGGVIAVTLWAVAVAVGVLTKTEYPVGIWISFGIVGAMALLHLMLVQLAQRPAQRVVAWLAFVAATHASGWTTFLMAAHQPGPYSVIPAISLPGVIVTTPVAAGLVGGFLMTMLLGHAYLTAGNEMTQSPFRRLVIMLGVLLVVRTVLSLAFGLWPYMHAEEVSSADRLWNTVMITARYLVGLAVPAIFTFMIDDCVRRRANQSATGILYVACVLVIVGEGVALALMAATGMVF